jgi:hypothetical protein
MFEHLHIDFAKEGWRASNHHDEFPQMICWLEQQEKTTSFSHYINWVWQNNDPGHGAATACNFAGQPIKMAKHPHAPGKRVTAIETDHNCPSFTQDLKEYLQSFLTQPRSGHALRNIPLPFDRLDVYHMFKFAPTALDDRSREGDDGGEDCQTVKAVPSVLGKPARFDTVVVLHSEDAEATGLAGVYLRAHASQLTGGTKCRHNGCTGESFVQAR